jgi:hypothetical protein
MHFRIDRIDMLDHPINDPINERPLSTRPRAGGVSPLSFARRRMRLTRSPTIKITIPQHRLRIDRRDRLDSATDDQGHQDHKLNQAKKSHA